MVKEKEERKNTKRVGERNSRKGTSRLWEDVGKRKIRRRNGGKKIANQRSKKGELGVYTGGMPTFARGAKKKRREGEGGEEGEKSKGKKRKKESNEEKEIKDGTSCGCGHACSYVVWGEERGESEEKRKGKEESAMEGGGGRREVAVSREIQRNMEKVRGREMEKERKTKNLYERVVEYFWTVGKKKAIYVYAT